MVGTAENVGHAMTYKVLTADTQKVIYCSNLHSASSDDPNQHVALLLVGSLLPNQHHLQSSSHAMMMLMGSPRITTCLFSAPLI